MSQPLDFIRQFFRAGNMSKIDRTNFGLGLFGNVLAGDAEGIGQGCLNSTNHSGSGQISPHRLTDWLMTLIHKSTLRRVATAVISFPTQPLEGIGA